jgi:hypothetical protein
MEEDIRVRDGSPLSITKTSERVTKRLEEAIEEASKRAQQESADDEELRRALSIVEAFIKRRQRVCYGGTAMNAIMPEEKKFYDPKYDLPDYDFYTPFVEEDIKELVHDLEKAGFKDIYHKVGIHKGTKKILVNFVPIADISYIEEELFNVLLKRSVLIDGVHYTDDIVLRMMMYLELSRPKGDVLRWKKVFERLELINEIFPIKACKYEKKVKVDNIPFSHRETIMEYIIKWQRILCNGPIIPLYKQGIRKHKSVFKIQEGGPVLFTSPDPRIDSLALKKILGPKVSLYRHKERGEIVPERIEIREDSTVLCMIMKETACHSFVNVPVSDGRIIYIGSLEFLISLYISLLIFTTKPEDILGGRILCSVKQFIELTNENYAATGSQFPPFSLQCRGHQARFASLLRAKFLRVQEERAKAPRTVRKRKTTKRKTKKKRSS